METLVCLWCHKSKTITEFCKSKVNKSGYAQPCKACAALEMRIKRMMSKWPSRVAVVIEKPADARQCIQCYRTKHIDEFPQYKTGYSAKSHTCKSCKHENYITLTQRTYEIPETKVCSTCKKLKPITEYGRQITSKDGRASRCRSCLSIAGPAYKAKRAELIKLEWARWYESHQPQILEYRRTHAQQIAARGSCWRKANAQQEAANEQRRRARKQSLPDTWTPEQLAFMLDYWQHACAVCGNPKGLFWKLAHDHWVPLVSPKCPGTTALNMIPLCHGEGGCNNSKNGTDPHMWLLRRFSSKKTAKIKKAIATYFAQVALAFPES